MNPILFRRIFTPNSGSLTSPVNRKRKRVKAPLYVPFVACNGESFIFGYRKAKDETPTDSTDSESPTTPTKASVRSSRGSNITRRGGQTKAPSPTPSAIEEDDVDGEDAEEVASMVGSEWSL